MCIPRQLLENSLNCLLVVFKTKQGIYLKSSKPTVDVYLGAQPQTTDRKKLLRRVRRAKRWADLTGSSPLLLVTYSEEAEGIMYVLLHIRLCNPTLIG